MSQQDPYPHDPYDADPYRDARRGGSRPSEGDVDAYGQPIGTPPTTPIPAAGQPAQGYPGGYPAPGYPYAAAPGYPAYPYPYPPYGYPPPRPMSASALVLTIISGIMTITCYCAPASLIPLVLGAVALSKNSTDPEEADRLARIGWVTLVGLTFVLIVAVVAFFWWLGSQPPSTY